MRAHVTHRPSRYRVAIAHASYVCVRVEHALTNTLVVLRLADVMRVGSGDEREVRCDGRVR